MRDLDRPPRLPDLEWARAVTKAEDAVIEAARSWAVAALNEPSRVQKCTKSLLSAVVALNALEAGE